MEAVRVSTPRVLVLGVAITFASLLPRPAPVPRTRREPAGCYHGCRSAMPSLIDVSEKLVEIETSIVQARERLVRRIDDDARMRAGRVTSYPIPRELLDPRLLSPHTSRGNQHAR